MNTESHAQAKFDGTTPFFFRTIRRYERIIYGVILAILFALLTIHIVRQPSSNVIAYDGNDYDLNAKYVQGNHELQVYQSTQDTPLYIAPDFGNAYNSKDGFIRQGDLFVIDEAGDGIQTSVSENKPHDNESTYYFKRIYILRNGDLKKRYVVDYSTHTQGEEEVATNNGIRGRFDSLIGHAYTHSQFTIDGDSNAFHYAGNGLYSITTQADTILYDLAGNQIETLEAGSQIFASFNSEFTTGFNHPTLLRIAGFKVEGGIEQYGTYFVEIFSSDDEFEYTFITQ